MFLPDPIMMVCAGNLFRSPFAEGLMRQRLQQAGAMAECYSRGLITMPGRKPPASVLKIAQEFDVDLSAPVSQPLLRPDVERAALVLVMDAKQRQHLVRMSPASVGKVFMLSQPVDGADIPDPVGLDDAVIRAVYAQIAGYVDAWLTRFGIA